MEKQLYLSEFTGADVELALRRAMTAVQSINGIRPSHSGNVFLENMAQEGSDTMYVAVVYTPYVENGCLCWENNGGLPNPQPVPLAALSGKTAVYSVNGAVPGENGALELTPAQLGAIAAGADVDLAGFRLRRIALPQQGDDAATKAYADRICTHEKSGTVHALTGIAGVGRLCFAATADYAAGDSFTYNGEPVTALTTGGEALPDKVFAAGTVVACCAGADGSLFFRAGGGDGKSRILVTAPTGSTVTCSCGGTVKSAVEENGLWTFTGCDLGTWLVSAVLGKQSAQTKVDIQEADQRMRYHVSLSYNRIPTFTYTGDYEIVNDADEPITTTQGNWKIRLLTSGTLTFDQLNGAANGIDVFCVGGGGAGGGAANSVAAGGGGGYTKTQGAIPVDAGIPYDVKVGAGGAANADGGDSSAFEVTAQGGKRGTAAGNWANTRGGAGGSGGGGAGYDTGGTGGSDGSNGMKGSGSTVGNVGEGQGTSTREFWDMDQDDTARLYAGGGGGGSYDGAPGSGGAGGGGRGGKSPAGGSPGVENSGGGGGGGTKSGNGGSGIVIIRNARGVA